VTLSRLNRLPAKTTEGLNTFGCEVENTLWVPWVGFRFITSPPKKLYANARKSWFHISAQHEDHRKLEMLDIVVYIDTAEYILPDVTYEFAGIGITGDPATNYYQTYASGLAKGHECYFGGDDLYSEGWIRFYRYDLPTRDTTGVAAGEFEFTMQGNSEECGERVVTKGRFDVKLQW